MAHAAVAEIRRPTLRRKHGNRRRCAGLGSLAGGRGHGREVTAALERGSRGPSGRKERVEHGLLTFRRLSDGGDPVRRRFKCRDECRRGRWLLCPERRGAPEECRAVQRTGRPADRADQRLANLAEEVSRRGGVGRAVLGCGTRIQHRDDCVESAIHVDAVIAVADCLVEGGEGRGLLVDAAGRCAQPGDETIVHEAVPR
jgi:hypothetical protein